MSEHTEGPWRWEINPQSKLIQLCGGKPRFDLTVMAFHRWGMRGAEPLFLDDRRILTPAREFAVIADGREHHSHWFRLLDHPDAHLIAAAPDMFDSLTANLGGWIGPELLDAAADRCDDSIIADLLRERAKMERRAITKAKGEKP